MYHGGAIRRQSHQLSFFTQSLEDPVPAYKYRCFLLRTPSFHSISRRSIKAFYNQFSQALKQLSKFKMQFSIATLLAVATVAVASPIVDIHVYEASSAKAGLIHANDVCLRNCWPETPTCPDGWVCCPFSVSCILGLPLYTTNLPWREPANSFFSTPTILV